MIKNQKMKNIEDVIKKVHMLYLQHGLKITGLHADTDFETLIAYMDDLIKYLNWASREKTFPDIERFNQTIQECVQSTRAAMTFKIFFKLVIVHLVSTSIFWLNDFPPS